MFNRDMPEDDLRVENKVAQGPDHEDWHTAVLNRISEEAVVRSQDTASAKKKQEEEQETEDMQAVHQEQLFTFKHTQEDDREEEKTNRHSPNKKFTESTEMEIQKEVIRREKERKRKKLEKKLKQLQELERILQQKEQNKKKRLWATKVIQKWVKGHLSRKKFKLIQNDYCYVRKLRRILSIAIKKYQTKFIKNLSYMMHKGGKEMYQNRINELKRQEKELEHIRRKQKEARREKIDLRILAFLKGWKVRKTMKCKEIVNIIKKFSELSVNIKRSQFNPQTKNFIYELVNHKKHLVEHFMSTFYRLYYTGDWIRTYRPDRYGSESTKKSYYHPNVVVNLSTTNTEMGSLSARGMPIEQSRPWESLNSAKKQLENTPVRNPARGLNWGNPSMNSSQQLQMSSFRVMNFNPVGQYPVQNMNMMPQNMRYMMPIQSTGVSISDNRPSDAEAMKLVNQVLGNASPMQSNAQFAYHHQHDRSAMQSQFMRPSQASQNPVVPEIKNNKQQAIRETIEIPTNQVMSMHTFTPVNVVEEVNRSYLESTPGRRGQQVRNLEDMPAQSRQLELSRISGSPEQIHQDLGASHASIEVPQYNFEEILKKALNDQGEDYVPDDDPKEEEPVKPKPKVKKNFLKRKKVYDPNEAIKKGNKKIKKSKKQKSAFPNNFFKKRSTTYISQSGSDSEHEPENVKEEKEVKKGKSESKRDKSPTTDKSNKSPKQVRIKDDSVDGIEQDNEQDDDAEDDEATEVKKDAKAKPFLKRKSRGVKFQKLNWNNVKSKTDCWTKQSARSEHREPREKSIPASNRQPTKKEKTKETELPKVKKSKNLQNIKSRIDTGIRKVNVNKYGSDEGDDSFEYNQYNVGEYANEEYDMITKRMGLQNQGADIRRFQFEKNPPQFENPSRYQNPPQYQNNPGHPQNHSNIDYEIFTSDDDTSHMIPQQPIPNNPKADSYPQFEPSNIVPHDISQLEQLYSSIHNSSVDLSPCTALNPYSVLPQITSNSIFLNCYSEEIYDIILEELRTQYEHLCNF